MLKSRLHLHRLQPPKHSLSFFSFLLYLPVKYKGNMSSSDCEQLISIITQSLPISEVIDHIKHSFRERHLNEAQNILRENDMKKEMENLRRDRDSATEQVYFLERDLDLCELEKLILEDKLQKSQRKCEELEKIVHRLVEEKKASDGREKKANELCDKISSENSKMEIENTKLVFELNEKVNELKNKNLESQRLVGVYQEKNKYLDTMVVKMGQEIDDLRHEKFGAKRTIDELKVKISESDNLAELYKCRLGNLSPRIKKIEENLAVMLNLKVGDLTGLVNDLGKLDNSEEGGNLEFSKFWGQNNNSSRNGDVVVLWPGVRSVSNSVASRSIGLSTKARDRNLVHSWISEDDGQTVNKISPGSQSGLSSQKPESNERKQPLGSGAQASGTRVMSEAGCLSKIASSAVGDPLEIIDSDDEANPAQTDGMGSNASKNKMKIVESPLPGKKSKRKRTDCLGVLFNGLKEEVSSESDECAESSMDDLIMGS